MRGDLDSCPNLQPLFKKQTHSCSRPRDHCFVLAQHSKQNLVEIDLVPTFLNPLIYRTLSSLLILTLFVSTKHPEHRLSKQKFSHSSFTTLNKDAF